MRHKALVLAEDEKARLLEIVKKGSDWRVRERAQTLLYLADGWRTEDIATAQELHRDTVYDRRQHWLDEGYASLVDKPRCGAPAKVGEAHKEQLRMWATQEALTARELVTKLKDEFGIDMHPNTLGVTLKRMKFVWKRTRHDLKKTR